MTRSANPRTPATAARLRAARCVLAGVVVACLAGCASTGSTTSSTTQTTSTTTVTSSAKTTTEAPLSTLAGTILTTGVQSTSFSQVKAAIDRLYTHHPTLTQYAYQDVAFSPSARKEVLDVCRTGGALAKSASAVESSKVFGCAPLIFFYYSYGQNAVAPDSVAVARQLYWYAATQIHGPFNAQASLTAILRAWGIH